MFVSSSLQLTTEQFKRVTSSSVTLQEFHNLKVRTATESLHAAAGDDCVIKCTPSVRKKFTAVHKATEHQKVTEISNASVDDDHLIQSTINFTAVPQI